MARLKKRNEELEETISNNTTFEIHQKFNLSLRQNEFVKLISHKDNNIIIAKGPAGTAKTYLSLFASLQLLKGR
jgi:phosphate starvation-inducible protein PhoH